MSTPPPVVILPSRLDGPSRPEFLRNELLAEIFAESAKLHRASVALRCREATLTYGELRSRATRFAHHLAARGLNPRGPVVLWMPRGLDMFVAFLGVLEAGGCYVPLDPESPPERVAFVAEDCGAALIVTVAEMAGRLPKGGPCPVLAFDDETGAIAAQPARPWSRRETGIGPEDIAYIIYTSGTTGRPKGVAVPHRAICHLVRSEGSVLALNSGDLVFQGFSLSFDMSLEEIWTAFAAGASLFVATRELMQSANEIAGVLARAGVTVWSCVPTLLALQESEVPTLRLLNLGGEACPPDLVRRWGRTGRRILNTYGPTETAVTATWTEVGDDRPITLGRPLPNYVVHVLDPELAPVPVGAQGELCVAGPGLALGYVGQEKLSREKFFEHPQLGRIYRTGDLTRINAAGELEFFGRMDTQIKIRGYRVELAEIENVILEDAQVRQVAVNVWHPPHGAELLVAYVVTRRGDTRPFAAHLRQRLQDRLPGYMVPAVIEFLDALPTLPSGKTDRKNLPAPCTQPAVEERNFLPPITDAEKILHGLWVELFPAMPVSTEADFFNDLGGHSLIAAALVSRLRRDPKFQHVSMADVYRHPTVQQLAAHLDNTAPRTAPHSSDAPRELFSKVKGPRYVLCVTAQALSLPIIYSLFSLPLIIPYLGYAWMIDEEQSRTMAVLAATGLSIALIPAIFAIVVTAKWVVLGRERPGRHPLWGLYYFRWWFVRRLLGVVPRDYLEGTPLLSLYLRMLGAKIGPNVHLASSEIDAPGLFAIGADSAVGHGAIVSCSRIDGGWLHLGRVSIGQHCSVGAGAVLTAGSVMEDHAQLGELSLLASEARIPAHETWSGSPAVRTGAGAARTGRRPSWRRRAGFGGIFTGLIAVRSLLAIAPIFPGMALIIHLDQNADGYEFLLLSPVFAIIFIVTMGLEIAALKWLLVGRMKPGRHDLYSVFYLRWWLVDQLMAMSLDIVKPLYATLYLAPWYRLLGVKVGARAEISTASAIAPDLLELGEESFIADAVMLGVPRVAEGMIIFESTHIGKRAFVGNSALIPAGTHVGDDVLIGCLSVPPVGGEGHQPGSSWFGIPAINLPQRQKMTQFDKGSTFHPRRALFLQRLVIEGIRVILPLTIIVAINSLLISLVIDLKDLVSWTELCVRFPFIYMVLALCAALLVVVLKWLAVGKYRPVEKPLWNHYVWRSELVTSTYEELAVPLLARHLQGTPFLGWYWRLLGARVGRRVCGETTDLTEFDVVEIGDDVALNPFCGLQTHLFEDRVMKISSVEVGRECSIGTSAIVLYDSHMETGATLDALSMLMKGETLPAYTVWQGSPARQVV